MREAPQEGSAPSIPPFLPGGNRLYVRRHPGANCRPKRDDLRVAVLKAVVLDETGEFEIAAVDECGECIQRGGDENGGAVVGGDPDPTRPPVRAAEWPEAPIDGVVGGDGG